VLTLTFADGVVAVEEVSMDSHLDFTGRR